MEVFFILTVDLGEWQHGTQNARMSEGQQLGDCVQREWAFSC